MFSFWSRNFLISNATPSAPTLISLSVSTLVPFLFTWVFATVLSITTVQELDFPGLPPSIVGCFLQAVCCIMGRMLFPQCTDRYTVCFSSYAQNSLNIFSTTFFAFLYSKGSWQRYGSWHTWLKGEIKCTCIGSRIDLTYTWVKQECTLYILSLKFGNWRSHFSFFYL